MQPKYFTKIMPKGMIRASAGEGLPLPGHFDLPGLP
jgi:hypothetical protein